MNSDEFHSQIRAVRTNVVVMISKLQSLATSLQNDTFFAEVNLKALDQCQAALQTLQNNDLVQQVKSVQTLLFDHAQEKLQEVRDKVEAVAPKKPEATKSTKRTKIAIVKTV